MTGYEVNVYQSEVLTAHCEGEYGPKERWRSAERIASHFRNAVTTPAAAFEAAVDVTVVEDAIPAPVEDTAASASIWTDADDPDRPDPPCGADGAETYTHLLSWWRAYGSCELSAPAADSNLLVTRGDEAYGGLAYVGDAPYATTRVGKFCAATPDPTYYSKEPYYYGEGPDDEYFALNTAIHEIGHNLVENVPNPDDWGQCEDHGSAHHRMGTVYENHGLGGPRSRTYTDSPMSHGSYNACMVYDSGSNFCSTGPDHPVSDVEAHDLRYSPCAVANLADPSGRDEGCR
jgi:hypothetical protein